MFCIVELFLFESAVISPDEGFENKEEEEEMEEE